MATLRLAQSSETDKHEGEVFCCAFTPDGGQVLSAGWDGQLRLWESSSGAQVAALAVSVKPLSACAVSPDARYWMAGSMEGMLLALDGTNQQLISEYIAHTRPISAIRFAPDGRHLVTASWDRNLCLSTVRREREGELLAGHEDIVAGCRFLPEGDAVLSWSYDGTVRLWDLEDLENSVTFQDHQDRVLAGNVSLDGRWAATASREGAVLLWDLHARALAGSLELPGEPRGCFFLPDGDALLLVDGSGRVGLFSLPDLQADFQLATHVPVQCGELSPCGNLLALGCDDGVVRFVAVEGVEEQPLFVTARQSTRRVASRLQKLFGRSSVRAVFECSCPACQRPVEVFDRLPGRPVACPHCRRALRFNQKTVIAPEPLSI